MNENDRADLAHQEYMRALEADNRRHEKFCPGCQAPSSTGAFCPACMLAMASPDPAGESASQLGFCPNCSTPSPGNIYCASCRVLLSEDRTRSDDIADESDGGESAHPGGAVEDAILAGQMAAYNNRFSETPELNALWQRAAEGTGRYEAARAAFWALVNTDSSPEAVYVRQLLEAAGFALGEKSAAPALGMTWDDGRETRMDSARALSIDHATPQSRDPDATTDPGNLRFMLQDDNSRRGARYDSDDRRYDTCPACGQPSRGGQRCEDCRAGR